MAASDYKMPGITDTEAGICTSPPLKRFSSEFGTFRSGILYTRFIEKRITHNTLLCCAIICTNRLRFLKDKISNLIIISESFSFPHCTANTSSLSEEFRETLARTSNIGESVFIEVFSFQHFKTKAMYRHFSFSLRKINEFKILKSYTRYIWQLTEL